MNENNNNPLDYEDFESERMSLDDLEASLNESLESELSDLAALEKDREQISNPDAIGEVVKTVVWEQFINQVGVVAGEDFKKENRNMNLDLRDSAHIQTAENFDKGNIASHNTKIDYQKRYDDWHDSFQLNDDGSIQTHPDRRSGKVLKTLKEGARYYIDKGRDTGSAAVHKDHTIPTAEIIRDPETAAHLSREEHADFANSKTNLGDLVAEANKSKNDSKMTDWLDSERNGQKPAERFNIDEKELRERDARAREEYEKRKQEGKIRSIEAGKQSQKEEFFRMGGKALRAAVMVLLADLVKSIIRKLIAWFRSSQKSFSTFIDSMKGSIHDFISNLKNNLLNAGNAIATSIATAIFGPVIGMIKNAWIFLKQGYKSLKEAINYIKNPENKSKPLSILMLEVGKIVVAGLTAGSAIVLSEVIEKGLMTIPVFAFQIPIIGSLASILGMFLGALVSGLIGALALRLIDKAVAKRLMNDNVSNSIAKQNEVLAIQNQVIEVNKEQVNTSNNQAASNIKQRHTEAHDFMKNAAQHIFDNGKDIDKVDTKSVDTSKSDQDLDDIFSTLNDL